MSKRTPIARSVTKKEEVPKLPPQELIKDFLTSIEDKLAE